MADIGDVNDTDQPGTNGSTLLDAREVLDALADPVVAANSSGQIVYANQAVTRVLGWDPKALCGHNITTLIPERLRPRHLAGFQRYIDTGEMRHPHGCVHVPALHHDGTEVPIELTLAGLEDATGTRLAVASLREAGESTEMERQLAITRYLRACNGAAARLTSLLNLDDVAHTVVDQLVTEFDATLARIWLYDQHAHRMRLYAEAHTRGQTLQHSDRSLDADALPTWLDAVMRTGQVFVVNSVADDARLDRGWLGEQGVVALGAYPLLSGDEARGALVHFSASRISDEMSEVLCSFASIVATSIHDVYRFQQAQSARDLAEEAQQRFAFLARASTAIASSLDLQTTLANLAQIVVQYLADWCIVDTIAEDGSIERVEIAHRDPAKLELVADYKRYETGPSGSRALLEVLRTGRPVLVPRISSEQIESAAQDATHLALLRRLDLNSFMSVPMRARDRTVGAITFVSTRTGRTYNEDDLSLAQDLAHRAATAVDNASLYLAARTAVQTRDEFISTVSHDLKNPIAAIKGRAQIMRRRVERLEIPDRDKLIEGLENIDANTTRMVRFISSLVEVARTRQDPSAQLHPEPTDLVDLARQVAREAQANAPSQTITVTSTEDEVIGNWDCTRIERVITNLVGNAIKYSPAGVEVTVAVRREADTDGTRAALSVQDHGLGIPAADLDHIFERYHRGSNVTSRIPGTGLGLSGVKQIVEQHGGSVAVESVEGQGSTFTVRLPL